MFKCSTFRRLKFSVLILVTFFKIDSFALSEVQIPSFCEARHGRICHFIQDYVDSTWPCEDERELFENFEIKFEEISSSVDGHERKNFNDLYSKMRDEYIVQKMEKIRESIPVKGFLSWPIIRNLVGKTKKKKIELELLKKQMDKDPQLFLKGEKVKDIVKFISEKDDEIIDYGLAYCFLYRKIHEVPEKTESIEEAHVITLQEEEKEDLSFEEIIKKRRIDMNYDLEEENSNDDGDDDLFEKVSSVSEVKDQEDKNGPTEMHNPLEILKNRMYPEEEDQGKKKELKVRKLPLSRIKALEESFK